MEQSERGFTPVLAGALAGVLTVIGFAVVHQLLISDIWFSFLPMAVLIAANEPPSELIAQALPLTAAFIVVAAAIPSLLWGRSLEKVGSNLVTSTLLIVLLGLNVSVLGLVDMSGGSPFVVIEFLALLVVIMLGYGVAFPVLARKGLFRAT